MRMLEKFSWSVKIAKHAGFSLRMDLTSNLAIPIVTHTLYDCYVFCAAHLQVTSQMEYAQNESLMSVAPSGTEAKWCKKGGEKLLLGAHCSNTS